MDEPKILCPQCGAEFLQTTAVATGGLCMKCVNTRRVQELLAKAAAQLPKAVPAITRAQLDKLVKQKSPSDLVDALFDPAYDKVSFRPDELTEGDIIIYNISTLIGEVCNGGIMQYMTNESGQWAHHCGRSLRTIGLPEYAQIIERCIAAFTDKTTPEAWEDDLYDYMNEQEEPFDAMEQALWERFHRHEGELLNKLAAYIRQHPEVFAAR